MPDLVASSCLAWAANSASMSAVLSAGSRWMSDVSLMAWSLAVCGDLRLDSSVAPVRLRDGEACMAVLPAFSLSVVVR